MKLERSLMRFDDKTEALAEEIIIDVDPSEMKHLFDIGDDLNMYLSYKIDSDAQRQFFSSIGCQLGEGEWFLECHYLN